MTVKEIANTFGMSVTKLAVISGYSRQGLYDVIEGKCNRNTDRFESFIDHLHFISMRILEQDIAEARIQLNLRTKALEQLKKQMQKGEENEVINNHSSI